MSIETIQADFRRKVGETVYVYSKGEYANMRLFLSADKKTGFAIKPDGDLVSVFNVGDKGRIQQAIPHLNDIGATKLDAFDEAGRLPELYGKGGFKEVRREPWNPAYAPPNWTGGTPDVVLSISTIVPLEYPCGSQVHAACSRSLPPDAAALVHCCWCRSYDMTTAASATFVPPRQVPPK